MKYDVSSIKTLGELEAIRKRPGMYIGSTDTRGLHHLIWEILSNSIDEAINGFGKCIQVSINEDNSITVIDEGRGMPVEIDKDSGLNGVQLIFTKLHTSGKFSDEDGYKTAGGLHGVGATVVNALSTKVEVVVLRNGHKYQMNFKDGGSKYSKLAIIGESKGTGSLVRFYPDPSIFTTLDFNFETIANRMRESAFLIPGVTFQLRDRRTGRDMDMCYKDGLLDFINRLIKNPDSKLFTPYGFSGEAEKIKVSGIFVYTNAESEDIHSFVNLVSTKDGGTHETGLRSGFTRAFNEYAHKNNLIKEKDSFAGDEVREGLTAIISLSIPESILQFEGQVKGKLGTNEAKSVVENITYDQVLNFLNNHKEVAQTLIRKIQKAQEVKEAVRKARAAARNGKKTANKETVISGKFKPANSKDPKKRELFLVEGDSAGGTAKQGRAAEYQAILPLRGKVLNTLKASNSEVEKNEELSTIINCLGTGFGDSFNVNDSQYGKVVIMTDADTDGAHIQTLILTFFFKYMRSLIEEGYVYIAMPPLYKVKANKEEVYCYDENELSDFRDKHAKLEIQRYKGLGEMNAEQLWETTMNPETRMLVKVDIEDFATADKQMNTLMGDKPELRRQWLEENVDFSLDDEYGGQ